MRVLVVEDDVVSAEFLDHALSYFGYEVTVATDGEEALEMLRTGVYRMVVSDWELPHMNGDELCRHIRAGCARSTRRSASGELTTQLRQFQRKESRWRETSAREQRLRSRRTDIV